MGCARIALTFVVGSLLAAGGASNQLFPGLLNGCGLWGHLLGRRIVFPCAMAPPESQADAVCCEALVALLPDSLDDWLYPRSLTTLAHLGCQILRFLFAAPIWMNGQTRFTLKSGRQTARCGQPHFDSQPFLKSRSLF